MRWTPALILAGSLLCVSLATADLITPSKLGPKVAIPGIGRRAISERFKANEPARAIVSGDGDTCLGLYIFDTHGNCVAKDDSTSPVSSDDLAVEWFPAGLHPYSVEVWNGGYLPSEFELGIR